MTRRVRGPRRGRAAGIAAVGIAMAVALAPQPARAQADTAAAPARGPGSAVGWAKWVAAAFAAGFTALGVEQHNSGNAAFRSLIRYCGQVTCALTPDGRYSDPLAEATYQAVVRSDRAAREWLVAGQVTAVGTAVLFVVDLMRQTEPPNIPYSGLMVDARDGITRVGWRIPIGDLTGR
jgi:hypothetical protein